MNDSPSTYCGPFELAERLGVGAMGAVFRGEHRRDETNAAVKILLAERAQTARFRREFRREVQALSQLSHSGIATIYDYGTLSERTARIGPPRFVEGAPWLAMEYVPGRTLGTSLRSGGWPAVESVVVQLLDALAHVHANGIVHRDLKLSNVMVTEEPGGSREVKLVDFGLAQLAAEQGEGADSDESVMGTPRYMPPEQIHGQFHRQGPWTDLYALGCLIWRILCERAPFEGDTDEEVLRAQLAREPGEFEPTIPVPEGTERWLQRLLAKLPSRRFRHAADAAWSFAQLDDPPEGGADPPLAETEVDTTELVAPSTTGSRQLQTLVLETPGTTRPEIAPLVDADRPSDASAGGAPEAGEPTEPAPAEPPPFPEDWSRGRSEAPTAVRGAGLELFPLRRFPTIDREDSRDAIWELFAEVLEHRRPRGLLLHGSPGLGKSRLAAWLCRRAYEVGAANPLAVRHQPHGDSGGEIGSALARHFRCTGLDWGDARSHLIAELTRLGVPREIRAHDATGILRAAGLRPPAEDRAGAGFRNARVARFAYRRILGHMAARRPVVLWLDDIEFSLRSAHFVSFLLNRDYDRRLPVLVVATARDSRLEASPRVEDELASLEETSWRHRRVGRLPPGIRGQFLDRMLKLEPPLRDDVLEHTDGHPLFTVQLLRDWVEREALEPTAEGFARTDGGEMPGDLEELWQLRLERFLAGFPQRARDSARRALELAAALGRHVDRDEWRGVGRRRGVDIPEELVAELVDAGLARNEQTNWSFTSDMLVEAVERHSRDARHWSADNRACADLLRSRHRQRPGVVGERRARHLREAGDLEAALEALREGIDWALETGQISRLKQFVERRRQWMEELEIPARDPRRAVNLARRAQGLYSSGEPDRAQEVAERAAELARETGDRTSLGESLRISSFIARNRAEFDEARELLDEAADEFEAIGDDDGLARCRFDRGILELNTDHPGRARAAFERAEQLAARAGNRMYELRSHTQIGFSRLAEGELERAQSVLDSLRETVHETDRPRVRIGYHFACGEVSRHRERWQDARSHYQISLKLAELGGSVNTYILRLSLAKLDLATGHHERARETLQELEERFREIDLVGVFQFVHLARACAAAGLRDWNEFDEQLEAARDASENASEYAYEFDWLVDLGVEIAGAAGREDAADALRELDADP